MHHRTGQKYYLFLDGSYNGIQAAPDIQYLFKGAQGCYDLDECLVGVLQEKDRHYIPHKCVANSYCENTAGSYRCICDEGYEGLFLMVTSMLETKCVGDKFVMLVTNSGCW